MNKNKLIFKVEDFPLGCFVDAKGNPVNKNTTGMTPKVPIPKEESSPDNEKEFWWQKD